MKICTDFKDLKKKDKALANELLRKVGTGEWQQDELYIHENLSKFAKHEVTDGWYAECNLERNYNGAPNLLDYIDYDELGRDISTSWDDSMHFLSENNRVVETSYGF